MNPLNTKIRLFKLEYLYFRELIISLRERNIPVYLVSGGFRIIINPVADYLKIDRENVYANTLKFDAEGKLVNIRLN